MKTFRKNTIRVGGSTAAYTVDTVYTVYTFVTALHCKTSASVPIYIVRKGLNAIGMGGCASEKKVGCVMEWIVSTGYHRD